MRLQFPDGELGTWMCVGAVTDRSARVWLRAPGPSPDGTGDVVLEVADGQSVSAELECEDGNDWVAAIDLEIARPAPGEAFTVRMGELERRGRLAPTPERPASFRFGFGSCHQPFRAGSGGTLIRHAGAGIYGPMIEQLRELEAEFLLLLGDQVYSDGTDSVDLKEWMRSGANGARTDDELVDAYRQLYRGYFHESGFRALLESFPSYLIWDDHDIADSWGSRLSESEDDRRLFRAARRAYGEYQHLHNPGASIPVDGAHDYSFVRGDVGFLVLDLRNDRDWESGVVLGAAQWEHVDRFLGAMAERGIATIFVTASIPLIHFPPHAVRVLQWVPGGKGSDVRDRWDATPFRAQRDELIARLGSWQRGGRRRQVVVLSGDVHAGAAFRVRDRDTGGVLHQWTSSSLSAPGGPAHDFVNWAGPRLVNWGERRCESVRIGSESRNNFGAVAVEALEGGGHRLSFDLYARARGSSLRRSFRAVAAPEVGST